MKNSAINYKKLSTILFLTASLLLSPLVSADEFRHWNKWTKAEKTSFVAYNAISYVDYKQTAWALDSSCECYEEGNPVLGRNPHPDKLLIIHAVANYTLYRMIGNSQPDTKTKMIWGISAVRLGVVIHNDSVGASWQVAF